MSAYDKLEQSGLSLHKAIAMGVITEADLDEGKSKSGTAPKPEKPVPQTAPTSRPYGSSN